MSYFDDASLVMIPSGYKTSKVYSVKPTDGSGDLTFTRSNDTATRVGPDGLIEKVRTNLILQSETFDNASWTKSNATITANSIANPVNGATTAETLTFTGASAAKYLLQNNTISGSYSQSVYFKYSTHQWMQLFQSGDGAFSANFDIQNGVLGSYNGCTPSIVSVGSGWYRCTITFTSTTATQFVIWAIDSGTDARATNSASTGSVYIFGAQMEASDFGATPYIATTSAAVSVGPVANVPRLDYLNSSCPKLILEGQRTNDVLSNTALNNYTATRATWGVNVGVAPTGYQEAEKLIEDTTATSSHFFSIGANYVSGTAYTWSIYVKADGRDEVLIQAGNQATFPLNCLFNLSTQTITNSGSGTGAIIDAGNGWYRLVVRNVVALATASTNYILFLRSGGTVNYTGNGTSGVLVWGAQRETATYETSVIPTLGAAVTRGADLAQKTSASALIGQTEGTIFWEIEVFTAPNVGAEDILVVDNGAASDLLYLSKGTDNSLIGDVYVASVRQAFFQSSVLSIGTHKAALAYANNNTAFFVDGVQVGTTDTSCSVPAMSRIQLGNGVLGPSLDKTAQLLVFPTRLSNADLAALTA